MTGPVAGGGWSGRSGWAARGSAPAASGSGSAPAVGGRPRCNDVGRANSRALAGQPTGPAQPERDDEQTGQQNQTGAGHDRAGRMLPVGDQFGPAAAGLDPTVEGGVAAAGVEAQFQLQAARRVQHEQRVDTARAPSR